MTKLEYVNRVRGVATVHDGDTCELLIDPGFHWTGIIEVRLNGVDCPEVLRGSPFERRIGAEVQAYVRAWLTAALAGGKLYVRTREDSRSFTRWLGDVWVDWPDGLTVNLAESLLAQTLYAVPSPGGRVQWHEIHDPQRNLP